MSTSTFDLFKIGIGPSSSHTVGPMIAARNFCLALQQEGQLDCVTALSAELYGSLALTGRGHLTDRAILLGLSGQTPAGVELDSIQPLVDAIQHEQRLSILGTHAVAFSPEADLRFHGDLLLPGHPNAMRFTARGGSGALRSEVWFSVGGGRVLREGDSRAGQQSREVPFPFSSAAELLQMAGRHGLAVWRLMFENEKAQRPESEVIEGVRRFWQVMQECTTRGLTTPGILPGGLDVPRRAPSLYARVAASDPRDPLHVMDWLNVYAIAVNEENAAGGRVVTAPTNGAAGIVPAVAHYYLHLLGGDDAGILRYFLASAAVGSLYAENASISGAEVGCQGEVGVACSMAAAGLVSALQGSNDEVEHAAEIAMEHNLGLTCDPIGGLVQIPCIERNAFGAVKAVNAARMAMRDTGQHKVTLDQVIRTMLQTGLDMQSRYKETSLAGLAVNVVEC